MTTQQERKTLFSNTYGHWVVTDEIMEFILPIKEIVKKQIDKRYIGYLDESGSEEYRDEIEYLDRSDSDSEDYYDEKVGLLKFIEKDYLDMSQYLYCERLCNKIISYLISIGELSENKHRKIFKKSTVYTTNGWCNFYYLIFEYPFRMKYLLFCDDTVTDISRRDILSRKAIFELIKYCVDLIVEDLRNTQTTKSARNI